MVGKRPIEPDDGVSVDISYSTRRAVVLDVALARINGPDGVGDLLANEIFIKGLS